MSAPAANHKTIGWLEHRSFLGFYYKIGWVEALNHTRKGLVAPRQHDRPRFLVIVELPQGVIQLGEKRDGQSIKSPRSIESD